MVLVLKLFIVSQFRVINVILSEAVAVLIVKCLCCTIKSIETRHFKLNSKYYFHKHKIYLRYRFCH
jgi:hypothetical protein